MEDEAGTGIGTAVPVASALLDDAGALGGMYVLLELGTTDVLVYEMVDVEVEITTTGMVLTLVLAMVITLDKVKVPPPLVHTLPCNRGGQFSEHSSNSSKGVHTYNWTTSLPIAIVADTAGA